MRRLLLIGVLAAAAGAEEDPYLAYVRTAPEFRAVGRIDSGDWDTWIYMPWYYRWTIGHDEEGGRFCREYGINGGFTDHGHGPIAWLERWDLRFYNDHTAGKGTLYLRGANRKSNWKRFQREPRAVRVVPLNEETLAAARRTIHQNLRKVRLSGACVAYALDDEISWGAFVLPLPWRLHEDDADYARWLARYRGRPHAPRYVTPEFTRRQLDRPLKEIDFSPFLDRMTYNDSVWANFVGALVEATNEDDTRTPCGFVGGQNPSLWGGYDYAKLFKKVQFIEAYDMASSHEILRSFNRDAVVPIVTTHFHQGADAARDRWEAWFRFAHGQRGMIAWVDGWFDGTSPRPWLEEFAPTLKELGGKQGPKLHRARWRHDGIALYYSHPSIQVSWVLDAEAHGATWPNRGRDDMLGTSHNVRRAWEYLLTDAGLQYDFIAYDEVVRDGIRDEYRVLILPACYALSDIEARRIEEFVGRGGRVVADFMCGLFDQHGKGRRRGVLDDLFGVAHDGSERRRDFFGGKLWVETDQDAGYETQSWRELLATHPGGRVREGFTVAERKLKGPYAKAAATYLNLSPQRYLQLREEGRDAERHRDLFVKHLGVTPWVRVTGDRHLETTCWTRGERTYLFVVQNPILRTDGKVKLERGTAKLELRFRRPVRDVVDERTGKKLGDGEHFRVAFHRIEAVLLSLRS
ncbi:MAG: beta-galactosidase trimerization domain-containing protein [Planctomycetota bacterium]|jgi:hypothetical protein